MGESMSDLEKALKDCEEIGIPDDELGDAKSLLERLQAEEKLMEDVREATKSGDLDKIQEAIDAAADVPMDDKRTKDMKAARDAIVKVFVGKCKDCVADKNHKAIEEEYLPKIKDELQSESGVKEATKFLGDIYKALIKDCVSDDNMVRIEEEIMPKCDEYGLDKVAKEKKAL